MPSALLTMTQAAERLKCSRQWVHYLIQQKRLKAELVGKRVYIIRASDLDKVAVRERAKPTKAARQPNKGRTKPRSPRGKR